MSRRLGICLFLVPLGLWMACNASVDPKWPESLGYVDYKAHNTEDGLRLSLAPPQVHHPFQADIPTFQSSVPSLSNQPAHLDVGGHLVADAQDSRNYQTLNTCGQELEASTSIPFVPLSLKSPSGQVERNFLIEPLGITVRNQQAPIQTHQENDATTGPCTVLLLRNLQFPQEIERKIPIDLNIRVQQASHSSNAEDVETTVPFEGVSLGHLSRPNQHSVEAIKSSAGNRDHHSSILPVLNIEGRRAAPYAFQKSLPSKLGETPPNGARGSQTHTNVPAQDSPYSLRPAPETGSISLLPFKLKEMQQQNTLPPREKGEKVEDPDSGQATAAPLLESELIVASTNRSTRNLRLLAPKSSKRTSNPSRQDQSTGLDAYPQSQEAKKIKLGPPSSNISRMQIHSRQRGSRKFIVPVQQKNKNLTDIFKFDAAVFGHKRYNSLRDQIKAENIVLRISELDQNGELKIPHDWSPRDIFGFFNMFAQLNLPKSIQKINKQRSNQKIPTYGVISLSTEQVAKLNRRELLGIALDHIDSQKERWFQFWEGRTGVPFEEMSLKQDPTQKSAKDFTGRDFALLLYYIDMIGTILQKFCSTDSEFDQDYGAKLLNLAAKLVEPSIQEKAFRNYIFKESSIQLPNHTHAESRKTYARPKQAYEWIWEWIKNIIYQSNEEKLKDLFFHKDKKIQKFAIAFFNDIFAYSIVKMNDRLCEHYIEVLIPPVE